MNRNQPSEEADNQLSVRRMPSGAGDATRANARTYLRHVERLLRGIDPSAIERVVVRLRHARERRATIFLAGNGGSAATAAHFANDLGKAALRADQPPVRVHCLSDNVPWLTALANDEGYEWVFAGQLENFADPGDVLVVISASGNSPNLLRAVEVAKSRGLTTVAFLGFDGGALLSRVDECIWIPTARGDYGPVEDCHGVLCHILTRSLAGEGPPPRRERPSAREGDQEDS